MWLAAIAWLAFPAAPLGSTPPMAAHSGHGRAPSPLNREYAICALLYTAYPLIPLLLSINVSHHLVNLNYFFNNSRVKPTSHHIQCALVT